MTRTLVSEAIRHCRSSQGRLDASRCLLARSHRLLNRAWWIAGASDGDGDDNHGAKGVIHIECRKHAGEPSEYLVSFGGHKDGVGAFYLGRASGFGPLIALLRKLRVQPAYMETALQVLTAQPHHEIPNVILTQSLIRELGL